MEQAMTQINIRLGTNLKSAGDIGLSRAQISPSQAVRALWTYFMTHSSEPETITRMIKTLEGDCPETIDNHKELVLEEGQRLMAQTSILLGSEAGNNVAERTDNELLEEALMERYESRGLL